MVGKKGQEEGTNTSRLSLFFLGHPQIERDGVPIKVDTRKGVALLCYLAVTGQSPSRDVLTNLLWPEYDQAHARNDLRYTLSTLNKALGGSWLEVEKDSVGLKRGEGLWVDVDQFHRHLSECQTHGHPLAEVCPDCVNPLTEAVRLYRGDFLAGFGLRDSVNFDDWQFFQTQSLCSEVEGVLEKLVLCHRGRDELEMAIGYARRWLELDRDNEKVHWHLMELYALSGQHAAALRQYRECVKVLKKELGASPQEETTQLYEAIKGKWLMAKLRSFKPSSAFPNVPSSLRVKSPSHSLSSESGQTLNGMRERSLPIQLTSFIGRKREIVEVKRLLITTRLLTLTGPGGCGKTRLALQAASGLLKKFTDGVWLVELAALSNPYLIPQAVAGALNVSEQSGRPLLATLSDYLQSKRLLLVLDNCEHLIEACATLCDSLLHACPNLRILATSREALSIAGETVWCVPALSFPDPRLLTAGADPSTGLRQAQSGSSEPALTLSETRGKGQALVSALTQYEAISLFIDRAVAVLQGFAVTDQNAPAVAQICYRLDGIPLAIELAAACVNVLSVEQIATQLDDCFRLLTEGSRTSPLRQQTLRATMDWSYNLLSEVEQVLFRRLSVFAGGFTLEGGEAVCVDGVSSNEILGLIMRLVKKSLMMIEHRGEARYRLLEVIRQYGREKLIEAGEESVLRGRHRDWFLGLAERAEPELRGPDQKVWLDRLEVEHDNLRVALEWSLKSGETEEGLRLAGAMWRFWYVRNYLNEGCRWLERVLAESGGASVSARAKALCGAGIMAWRQEDCGRATALFEKSLILFRELGDKWGIAESLRGLGFVARDQRDYGQAIKLFEESLVLLREIGDKKSIAWPLNDLGVVALSQGDYDRAVVLCRESLALFLETCDKWGSAVSLKILGDAAYYQSDYERSAALFEESLVLFRELGDKHGIAWCLKGLAGVAVAQGQLERAEELCKESLALYKELGNKKDIPDCLECLARVALAQKQPELAARLFGTAEALREAIGVLLLPSNRTDYDRSVVAVRARLGEEAFAAVWEEGRRMTPEEVVTVRRQTMSEQVAKAPQPAAVVVPPLTVPTSGAPIKLTTREVEVLCLVAKGLTNAHVAERLSLSICTVNSHLRSIYKKIGVTSRTAATHYAFDHKLV